MNLKNLIIPITLMAQPIAYSQDLSLSSILELQEVSVASNVISDPRKQPATVSTFSGQELKNSGGRTLLDAIVNLTPGMFVVEDQDDQLIAFRGLASDNNSKVMLLINGNVVNTEFFWGPALALLKSIQFDHVERVEVIRGPGSVTLGQGALAGVISIVTNGSSALKADGTMTSVTEVVGKNNLIGTSVEQTTKKGDLGTYLFYNNSSYKGQTLRAGGISNGAFEGNGGSATNTVAKFANHHVNHTENQFFLGRVNFGKNLEVNLMQADSSWELGNWKRDRDGVRQKLSTVHAIKTTEINETVTNKTSANFAVDEIFLRSLRTGIATGGVSENRLGVASITNFKDFLVKANNMAFGLEFKRFMLGRSNSQGQNYINNSISEVSTSPNTSHTYAYKSDYNLYSAFVEDFYTVTPMIDVFFAGRFDQHKYWGSNFSPRFGAILSPNDETRIRVSYSEGFRGAVGANYSGGYKQDGFLREGNFGSATAAGKVGGNNGAAISKVKPEKISSIEIQADYQDKNGLKLNTVAFLNEIKNTIGTDYFMSTANMGSDVAGSWNGYWYYQNVAKKLRYYGFEATASKKLGAFEPAVSHSYVTNASASAAGSSYITNKKNVSAYPENVTRYSLKYEVNQSLNAVASYLRNYGWIDGADIKYAGAGFFNLAVNYAQNEKLSYSVVVKNVLDEKKGLLPYNYTGSAPASGGGSPAYESRTFWANVKYTF